MTDSKDYRLYLEDKFSRLMDKITDGNASINDKLDVIHQQTERTNSRVNHLEIESTVLEAKVDKAIADGKHVIDTRITECPNIKRFEKLEIKMEGLESKLEDAMFFIRHPKVFMGIIIFFVLASLFTLYQTVHDTGLLRDARYDMNSTKIEAQKINDAINQIQTRGIKVNKDTANGTHTH
jgi:hypothetical protein